ncbi:hypothetical protein L9F63_005490 [Diploptera punctata]|uniref:Ionotropic glutamate receptor C-terminal domain-containing protein n=1 Tax=Diploptera punctata TaxID=6984 RepID=A0AAD7ZCP8_DIPPU|nr:hypothetical protein L9F63_005490 [Diploptera punctata]
MFQVCSIWLRAEPQIGIQHSFPYSRQKVTLLAPKPQPLPRALLLYLPLQFWTWIILLSTLLSFGLMLKGTTRLLQYFNYYQNVQHCFLDACRILLLSSPPRLPQPTALRYLLIAWAFFSLLTTTVYSSGFTSLLTSPLYSDPINTIQDLLDQNIQWGDQSLDFNDLIEKSDNYKLIKFGQKFKREILPEDREKRITQRNYAIFCKVFSKSFVTESEKLSPKAREILRVIEEPVFLFYIGIGLRENSPYKSYFDSTILRLEQAGLTDFWQHFTIYSLGYHYMSDFFNLQNEIHRQPLTLNSLQGAFCLLVIGLIIAGFTFICEILLKHFA